MVDINAPDHLYNDFSEFPPIFRNLLFKDNLKS